MSTRDIKQIAKRLRFGWSYGHIPPAEAHQLHYGSVLLGLGRPKADVTASVWIAAIAFGNGILALELDMQEELEGL